MTIAINEEFTPQSVRFHSFPTVKRNGLDPDFVGKYLFDLAGHLVERDNREAELRSTAEDAVERLNAYHGNIQTEPNAQAVQMMNRAQHEADRIVGSAQAQARHLLADARRRASGIWAQAEAVAAEGILNLGQVDIFSSTSGDLAANVREKAERLDEAEKQIKVLRQAMLDQLEDLRNAVHDAEKRL